MAQMGPETMKITLGILQIIGGVSMIISGLIVIFAGA